MGNCTRTASRDVAESPVSGAEATGGLAAAAPAPPPPRRHSAELHSATATLAEQREKKHRHHKRKSSDNGTDGNAAEASSPPSGSPDNPAKDAHRSGGGGGGGGGSSSSPPGAEHRRHLSRGEAPDTPQGATARTTSTPQKDDERKDGAAHSPSSPSSEVQGASLDSIAVRLEQGSTYIWLRNTYANPNLRPAPLLTLDSLRRLRNHNVAFQRLWSVLGQAACVIGPYGANPTPAPPLLNGEADGDDTEEVKNSASSVEPSFVNDEAQLRAHRTRNGKPTDTTAHSAAAGTSTSGSAAATTTTAAAKAGKESGEVRVLNQHHISIEGEETQKHPLVCRGGFYRGKHFWVHKLRSRCCFVLEHTTSVDLNDCSDTLIVLAPTAGAVSISNCRRCLIVAVAAQLRVLSCSSLVLSVSVAGFPVMEKSTGIGVAPLLGWYAYSTLPTDFQRASLSLFTNNYSTVRDVTPPSPSNGTNTSFRSTSGTSGTPGTLSAKPSHALLPATNFVYVDLWELEAAVWKAMAEQRWGQLIAEADIATATASAAAGGGGGANGNNNTSDGAAKNTAVPSISSSKSFLTALTPAHSPLISGAADASNAGVVDLTAPHPHDFAEDDDEDVHDDDNVAASEGAFHSMISFGHFSPSTLSKTHVKGGSSLTTTSGDASRSRQTPAQQQQQQHQQLDERSVSSPTGDTVPPLPRWRQPGFLGNVIASKSGVTSPHTHDDKRGKAQQQQQQHQADYALRQRGVSREAEHLVRVVLRTVPLLPLSALVEAQSLLLDVTTHTGAAAAAVTASASEGAATTAEQRRAARCNPLELALATYTHTCAVPSTFGAQLIPADFFEQSWKLKLIVLSTKSGGYDLARRIARDIEVSRRRCFLESVRAMLHAPPPSTQLDASSGRGREDGDGGSKGSGSSNGGGGSARDAALPTTEEEDAFSEVLWYYLRTTSLSQRCGPVLLLNTAELRCTETMMREFVAPVFYKLCEPVGAKSSGAARAAAPSANSGASRGLHLPWKSGAAHQANSNNNNSAASPEQQEHNVEMRRLFGTAIQRMTGQTCIALLAFMAPKSIPQSFQRPLGSGGRSIGGALTPAELDAWAKRAEEARHIFTPQRDPDEEGEHNTDPAAAAAATSGGTDVHDAADEPTAAKDGHAVAAAGEEGKRSGPTFAPPGEGEAAPQTREERVWPQTVLLNVTVPTRFVSLLQGTLFFKTQMHAAATAGGPQMREQELGQKN